jgi:hypothetical protein
MAADQIPGGSAVDRLPYTTLTFSAAYVRALREEEAWEDPLNAARGIFFGVSFMSAVASWICWIAFG